MPGRGLLPGVKRASLRQVHWEKLAVPPASDSLWASTDPVVEGMLDTDDLTQMFTLQSGNKLGAKPKGKPPPRSIVDLQRTNNCEIMLSQMKMSTSEVLAAALALDDGVLTETNVEGLLRFLPTPEEAQKLKAFRGNVETLSKCERFFLDTLRIPRLGAKLRVFLVKLSFEAQVASVREGMQTVVRFAEEVRNSAGLKGLMQAILSLGNALNAGTAKGSATGFRLASLESLAGVKAADNKTTLLQYLCGVLDEKAPEFLTWRTEMPSLEDAARTTLDTLSQEMAELDKSLESAASELARSRNDAGDAAEEDQAGESHEVLETFCSSTAEFLRDAEAQAREVSTLYVQALRASDGLVAYFGEKSTATKFEEIANRLVEFSTTFSAALETHKRSKERARRESEAKQQQEKPKAPAEASSPPAESGAPAPAEAQAVADRPNVLRQRAASSPPAPRADEGAGSLASAGPAELLARRLSLIERKCDGGDNDSGSDWDD